MMSHAGGLQSVNASKGFEVGAKKNYETIREVIKSNSMEALNTVIPKIAKVQRTSFNNYVKGGNVSEFVVQNLVKFSGLEREYFTGQKPFSEEQQRIFGEKVRQKFGRNPESERNSLNSTTDVACNDFEKMTKNIADYVSKLGNFDYVDQIDGCMKKLESLVEIAKISKQLFEKKSTL